MIERDGFNIDWRDYFYSFSESRVNLVRERMFRLLVVSNVELKREL